MRCHSEQSEESRSASHVTQFQGEIPRFARNDTATVGGNRG
jgi:hypothetical protein